MADAIRAMADAIRAVALDGKVCIQVTEGPRWHAGDLCDLELDLTPEQADALWNGIAEAELVALEQRVRARRRVTEGARGGWVNAPARGRHAVDAGMALAESTTAALDRLAPRANPGPPFCPVCSGLITFTVENGPPRWDCPNGHAANVGATAFVRDGSHKTAAPEPGDPYPAPDYQHPEPGDEAGQ